ncbi:AMP-binding protein [Mammaliicoccus sp. I-M36]|uniref:AMP-binding protein n=1 Tax=Mammaliicoccus sp. I-M36 TaxID=2898695 RepID=UPI001EFB27AB|nr:AMP-binding protein [Mammaliicoccus sp. I-M36]
MYINNENEFSSKSMHKSTNTNRTILEAFTTSNNNTNSSERLEKKIELPNGSIATIDSAIAASAIIGSLLSTEGRVNIGINNDASPTYFEIDTTNLLSIEDTQSYIYNLRKKFEKKIENSITPIDIEISNSKRYLSKDSTIWLLLQSKSCVISVKSDCIDSNMFSHLCKIVEIAFEKSLKNKNIVATPDILPKHAKNKVHKHRSMVEYIYEHKKNTPLNIAVFDQNSGTSLTYEALWNKTDILINNIYNQLNIQKAPIKIALFLERGWQHLVSIIAIQRLGGSCILIDLTNPDERIRDFLSECKPDAIISDDKNLGRSLKLTNTIILNFENDLFNTRTNNVNNNKISKINNNICFIACTSGSTGKPKSACLSYHGMSATINNIIKITKLDEDSRGSWLSSPGYGMIEVDPLPILCAGGTLCIPNNDVLKDIQMLSKWFIENKITHTLVMTSIAEALWSSGFNSVLQNMMIAGERCKQWPKTEYDVLNVYGSAEAAVVSIENLSSIRRTALPSVGKAVPGVNMYVVDDNKNELPACCIGELVITGDTLSVGYIDDYQTHKSFQPNKLDKSSKLQYLTGDRARMSLDGTVEIFGRSNRLVKIRGHRVDLTEIEIHALQIHGISKAAALCTKDKIGDVIELFIEVVTESDSEFIKNKLKNHLKRKLHPASLPNQIRTINIPLNVNGKVDYSALFSFTKENNEIVSNIYPSTRIETALYDCWLEWTKSDEITFESDFFEEGGDSLRVMRMLGELTHIYGIKVDMIAFLENPKFSNLLYLSTVSNSTQMPNFERLPYNKQAEKFELTEYQQALWLGSSSEFGYGNKGCRGYFEWEVENLDENQFTRAVEMLIKRHPMLQTVIDNNGYQRMVDFDTNSVIESTDISNLSKSEINYEINNIRLQLTNSETDTEHWPLTRFIISRLSSKISRIHFSIDLLIADAWSIFQVIIPDLIDLYNKSESKMPRIKTTFHDYVAYRSKVKNSNQYHSDRKYWLEKIKNLPESPKLPHDKKLKETNSTKFSRLEGKIENEEWNALKKEGQKRKISSSALVALVFCEVIRNWSEEKDFTLNFPISDRMSVTDDINSIIGDFTNPLLVNYCVSDKDVLEKRGRILQDTIWQALDHRLFTGVEVLRELSRLKRTGTKPLMPVVFTSLLGHTGRHDASLLGREVFSMSQTPQVTLDVQVREVNGVLHFKWDYLDGAIQTGVLEEMFNTFYNLLKKLAVEPDIWEHKIFDD